MWPPHTNTLESGTSFQTCKGPAWLTALIQTNCSLSYVSIDDIANYSACAGRGHILCQYYTTFQLTINSPNILSAITDQCGRELLNTYTFTLTILFWWPSRLLAMLLQLSLIIVTREPKKRGKATHHVWQCWALRLIRGPWKYTYH